MLARSARAAGPACTPTVSTSLAEFPFRRLAALLEAIRTRRGAHGPTSPWASPSMRRRRCWRRPWPRNAHLWNRYPPPLGTPAFRETAAGGLARAPGSACHRRSGESARHIATVGGDERGPLHAGRGHRARTTGGGSAGRADAEPGLRRLLRCRRHGRCRARASPRHGRDRLPARLRCPPAGAPGAHGAGLSLLARQPTRARRGRGLSRAAPFALARKHGFVLAVDECYSRD